MKNNWELDRGDYFAREQDDIRLDRLPPGRGYRHLVDDRQRPGIHGRTCPPASTSRPIGSFKRA